MKNNEAMAKELFERYPKLAGVKPPYTLNVFGKRIKAFFYSAAGEAIKELQAENLCSRRNAFSTDFGGNSYGVFIKDGLDSLSTLKCMLHEIGHIANGHLVLDGSYDDYIDPTIEQREEAEANDFEACCQRLIREKEARIHRKRNAKYILVGIILAVTVSISIFLWQCERGGIDKIPPALDVTEQAPPPITEDYVYAISYKHQYHRAHCRHISHKQPDELIKMTKEEALRKLGESGACRDCMPLEE